MKAAIFLVLFIAGCATPAPVSLKPDHKLPPDIMLICHESGNWAVVSMLAQQGAVFNAPCGPNA